MPTQALPLPGDLTATKTRYGDPNTQHTITLDGSILYRIQQTLRAAATDAKSYEATRDAVNQAEALRIAIHLGTTHP